MGVLAIQDVTPPERVHRFHHIAIIIVTFLITVAATVLIFMFLSNDDEGVFDHSDEKMRMSYEMDVLPAGPVTGLAVVVYLWQILWTLYSLTTIPRSTEGGYLYYSPKYMCMYISLFFSFAVIVHIIWVFLWDANKLIPEVAVLGGATVLMSIALFIALKAMVCGGMELIKQGKQADVIMARLFMHNGIAMFFTWLWFSTFIHIGLVVSTEKDLSEKDASSLSLGLIGFWILLEGVLFIHVFDKYTRYVFGNYVVQIWMLLEMVIRRWDSNNRNSIIALILLIVAIVLLLIKIGYVIKKAFINPEPLYGCPQANFSTNHNSGYVHDQKIDGVINLPPLKEERPPVEILNFITPEPGRTYVYREPTQSVPVHEVFQPQPQPQSCRFPSTTYEHLNRPSTPYVDHRAPTIEVLNAPTHATYRGYGPRSRSHSTLRGTPMGLINVPGGAVPVHTHCPPIQPVYMSPQSCCSHMAPAPPVHMCSPPTVMQAPHCGGCGHRSWDTTSFYA